MNRMFAAFSIWLCGGAALARAPKPMTADDSCPFVAAAAAHALWQFEKDQCGFVFDAAKNDGIIYAEAVGFDPMPSETISCQSAGWLIQIGQHPPNANAVHLKVQLRNPEGEAPGRRGRKEAGRA